MNHVVKHKSVAITVYPWIHPSGRKYWRFKANGKHVTRASLKDAKDAAKAQARTTYRGEVDLSDLSDDQRTAVRRLIESGITASDVSEFLEWKRRFRPAVPLDAAREKFLSAKKVSGHYHRRNLTRYLALLSPLGSSMMDSVTADDLRALLPAGAAPRTLANIRQSWVTFWRWSARNNLVSKENADMPSILDLPAVVRGIPAIYSDEELRKLFDNVKPSYLPWLAMAAFAGLRTEEVAPIKHSDKSPLDWADFHWDRDIIIVRPETAKTGRRRVVPILPALEKWLRPIAKESGRLAPRVPPSAGEGKAMAETTRLGGFIGGWKRNALRHSWITYRAAMVGISQTAMEAGNSESEARRSYVDAAGKDVAEKWFSVFPLCSPDGPDDAPEPSNKKSGSP